ncbi:GFA family protein [Saccharospirillum alexandrii]|uniref:GFA family protein n=1 Tax=Saccharospirillum alexandrii TaxID=2448477 RepID=UPI000FD8E994|nr:GFA family protein [Saccharospirillum alexandrii]
MTNALNAVSGGCLCGAVRFAVNGPVSAFHLCHCDRCRHSTGSAFAANLFTVPEAISWEQGEDQIKRFELPTAKHWTRQFCATCGSALPYVNRSGKFLVVPAGSLDGDPAVTPDDRIFWSERPHWVDAIGESPVFDRYPTR